MAVNLPSPIRGVIPPLVTPLLDSNRLDVDGLGHVVERMLAAGVHGLFALGTTGEAPNLSRALREQTVKEACRLAAGRVPVFAGISDCSVDEALQQADAAAEAGASAVVFTPPYYFPNSQAEVLRFSERLARRLSLPYLLYNIPSHTRNGFDVETARTICGWQGCLGIKDSTGDWAFFERLVAALRDKPATTVLMGPEELLAEAVWAGGHGGVTGGANLAPELFVGLYHAAVEGRRAEALALRERVLQLGRRVYGAAPGASGYLRGLKCALELAGLCSGTLSDSFEPVGGEAREQIRTALIELELMPGR
jgi:dihydrodipicolinate synthase/N-acetylneuraminate lyase